MCAQKSQSKHSGCKSTWDTGGHMRLTSFCIETVKSRTCHTQALSFWKRYFWTYSEADGRTPEVILLILTNDTIGRAILLPVITHLPQTSGQAHMCRFSLIILPLSGEGKKTIVLSLPQYCFVQTAGSAVSGKHRNGTTRDRTKMRLLYLTRHTPPSDVLSHIY